MHNDRVYTVGIPTGAGPLAIPQDLQLPDTGAYDLEAWISNFGSSNVHLFRQRLSLVEVTNRLETGFIDALMTLTSAGPARIHLPDDTRSVTVFFEALNNSGQFEAVTLRVATCRCH